MILAMNMTYIAIALKLLLAES